MNDLASWGHTLLLYVSGPMKNNDPSLSATGKATSRGLTIPFSADSDASMYPKSIRQILLADF